MQPAAFVFDAYGTLFDVHSAAAQHADALGEGCLTLSELWRTKQPPLADIPAASAQQLIASCAQRGEVGQSRTGHESGGGSP